jgi:copper chaperone CopZ
MKAFIKYSILTVFLFGMHALNAQSADNSKTETIKLHVPGVCNMCKGRIETTTYDVAGIKSANWDLKTDTLTAVVSPKKASAQKIADALAKAGYRSDLAKADPKAYQNLPACCRYDDGIEKHGN